MRYVYCIHQSPHTCIVDNRHLCKKEGMFVFSEKGQNSFPRRLTCLLFGVLLKSKFLFTYCFCSPCVQLFMYKTLNHKLLRLGQHWAETTGRKLSDNQPVWYVKRCMEQLGVNYKTALLLYHHKSRALAVSTSIKLAVREKHRTYRNTLAILYVTCWNWG